MLKIREAQVDQLAPFRRRMRDLLRRHFPETREVPARQVDAAISRQTKEGRSYHLVTERQLGIYVLTAFLLGEDFDTKFPAAKAVLASDMEPDAKVDWVEAWSKEMFDTLANG